MKYSLATALTLLAGLSMVSGHAIFQKLYVDGIDQGHLVGIRAPDSNSPIEDVTSDNLICNTGLTHLSDTIISVTAGSTVTAEWHHTLSSEGDTSDSDEPIASSHKGPIITYLAAIDDALATDVTGLNWFKIQEDGYDGTNWAVDRMISNNGKVDITIPSCIPDGQYLMRHELIALHSATSYPGAQFYMECAQIEVTGGGCAEPDTVSIPGLYASTDPGITVNIYYGLSDYTIPGPTLFSCDA